MAQNGKKMPQPQNDQKTANMDKNGQHGQKQLKWPKVIKTVKPTYNFQIGLKLGCVWLGKTT